MAYLLLSLDKIESVRVWFYWSPAVTCSLRGIKTVQSRWLKGSSRKENVPLSDLQYTVESLPMFLEMCAVKLNSSSENPLCQIESRCTLCVLPEKVFTHQSTTRGVICQSLWQMASPRKQWPHPGNASEGNERPCVSTEGGCWLS